jgi:hypothetical protein
MKEDERWLWPLALSVCIIALIAIATSCGATHESTNIVEPSDSTNYNVPHVMP